jgi:putative peptide zinc metalloprotease protein
VYCQIGDSAELEAVAVIDQADAAMIGEKMGVEIKFPTYAGEIFSGEVVEVAKVDLKSTPQGLATEAGGDIATKADPSGRQRPLSTSYQARIPLDDPNGRLKVGMRGNVRIYTDWQPLWNRIWRYLTQTFHFRM